MKNSRDDFDIDVINALKMRAAFICSNPDCKRLTVAPSSEDELKFIYIGIAAHICAASEKGPRYDPNMTPDERKSIVNGVFLCSGCSVMIDKNQGIDFSVDLLRQWKMRHESWVRNNLNKKVNDQPTPLQVYNVISTNQSGGITAAVVNFEKQPRIVNQKAKDDLLMMLPDKKQTVTVVYTRYCQMLWIAGSRVASIGRLTTELDGKSGKMRVLPSGNFTPA